MKLKTNIVYIVIFLLTACTSNTAKIKNEKRGQLKASIKIEVSDEKKIKLDENSAPKPIYTQLFTALDGERYFTFLNEYNNSIYFYNYNTLTFDKKITWEKNGPNGVASLKAYHIKSLDSIYLYNKRVLEFILSNSKSEVLSKTSLCDNKLKDPKWGFKYPQYNPQTVIPIIATGNELILNGFFFGSIPESILSKFNFTARINFKTNQLKFSNTYPPSLYGYNYNWEGELFTEVFSDLHPDGDKLVLSFPVSHDLYLADLNDGKYKKIYGGSNFANTICSLNKNPKNTTDKEIMSRIIQQDEYTAIKYDKYRKVYYRFLLKSIPNATIRTNWKEKPIAIIIMDEKFNYLGETVIGTGKEWNWQNSFVTEEGLNIEYIEKSFDEVSLTLKIFTLKKT